MLSVKPESLQILLTSLISMGEEVKKNAVEKNIELSYDDHRHPQKQVAHKVMRRERGNGVLLLWQ